MTPLSGLITGGLGLPACQGMIVNRFHLFGCGISVSVHTESGGGPYPRPGAWNVIPDIQNFYKPVDPRNYLQQQPWGRKTHHVIVTITIDDQTTTKEYLVGEKFAHSIVKVADVINATMQRIRVLVSNIKKTAYRMVNVLHIRVRRKR